MEFLGMIRPQKPVVNNWMNPESQQADVEAKRKAVQQANLANYEDAKEMILEEIDATERTTIMEDMLKERREWVANFRRTHQGKIPDDLEQFHKRFDVEDPKKGDKEEEEEAPKKKGKKAGGGTKAPKGKGKKKKGGGDDKQAIVKVGPSETVRHFETFY